MSMDRKASVARVHHAVNAALKARDEFWSGVWWTILRRRWQERRLARALEKFGEDSMQARAAAEQYRRLEDGVTYWRPSQPIIIAALKASEQSGVSRSDLRIFALNRDLRRVGDTVRVRCAWWMPYLTFAAVSVTLLAWAVLVLAVTASARSWLGEVAGVAAVSVYLWLLWPGFGLFTTRSAAAARRSANLIEMAMSQLPPQGASVTRILSRGIRPRTPML